MKKPFLSIITPTFNRADTLVRLYESLRSQDDTDFEWIVVDDGSTDNTKETIDSFIGNDNGFHIEYTYQENKGMHWACNVGLGKVRGEMAVLVGSDDALTPDAVSSVRTAVNGLPKGERFAGVAFSLDDETGAPVGSRLPTDFVDATVLEQGRLGITGDKAQVYFSSIYTKYRFPSFEGEKFSEIAYVFNQIAEEGYKLRWFNKVIYIAEYSEGGLTKLGDARYKGSPKGRALYISQLMKHSGFIQRCLLQGLYARNVYGYKNLRQASSMLEGGSYLQMLIGTTIRRIARK